MTAFVQLRPDPLPVVEGVELAAAHLPGEEDCCDWYDVIVLPDGALGLAIGDVSGRGEEAYALASRLREAVRERALAGDAPGQVVGHVNSLVRDGEMATLLYIGFDPATGVLRGSNAAHPPALVRRMGGGVERWDAGLSTPLGVEPPAPYPEEGLQLAPGEAVLLYTDGLIERRGAAVDVTLKRLEQAMLVFGTADGLRTAVLDAMLGDHDHDDDVAVLTLAIPDGG